MAYLLLFSEKNKIKVLVVGRLAVVNLKQVYSLWNTVM